MMAVSAQFYWLLLSLLPDLASPVLSGIPVPDSDPAHHAVIAVWGKSGTAAADVRCTGVFIAPEVVLTAASCVLAAEPATLLQHAACAHGGAGCPTLPADTLEVLAANELPEKREPTAEVLSYEFRYSVPTSMPQVCTGGAVCGEGWDIAALRVRQLCPRQRCVPPLPLSLGTLRAGEPLRLIGSGMDPAAATPELASHMLRHTSGELSSVTANQTLSMRAPLVPMWVQQPQGPTACEGDAGAPVLRYEDHLRDTTGDGQSGEMYGEIEAAAGGDIILDEYGNQRPRESPQLYSSSGALLSEAGGYSSDAGCWAVVGIHTRIIGTATSGAGSCAVTPGATSGGRFWLTRVSRCWLFRVMTIWRSLPESMLPPLPLDLDEPRRSHIGRTTAPADFIGQRPMGRHGRPGVRGDFIGQRPMGRPPRRTPAHCTDPQRMQRDCLGSLAARIALTVNVPS